MVSKLVLPSLAHRSTRVAPGGLEARCAPGAISVLCTIMAARSV
jgi:hypothetical protein